MKKLLLISLLSLPVQAETIKGSYMDVANLACSKHPARDICYKAISSLVENTHQLAYMQGRVDERLNKEVKKAVSIEINNK